MKNKVEFVGIIVKINGKKKIFKKGHLYFQGWGFEGEDCSDNGINVEIWNGKKKYRMNEYDLNY